MTTVRIYEFFCGNLDCPSRLAGKTFEVAQCSTMEAAIRASFYDRKNFGGFIDDVDDGELWVCPTCREKAVS